MYINKWLYYPWMKNSDLDFLISETHLGKVDALGIVFCIDQDESFITIKDAKGTFKVKKEGIKRILPTPKFIWEEEIREKGREDLKAKIDFFFWHYNKEQYLYYISINGKRNSRQFAENELVR